MTGDEDIDPIGDEVELGESGLLRLDGPWANEKLWYIERYMDIFTRSMKTKWPRRVYIDLFSGPGRSKVKDTEQEFHGSPLRALTMRAPFTELYFNDSKPAVADALRRRIPAKDRPRVTIANLDCNDAALAAGRQFFGGWNESKTLGLAVVDPTAFQISLDALRQMTLNRRIDLIITYMTGFLRRFIAEPGYETPLDQFYGSDGWRDFVEFRESGHRITQRALLDFYEGRLRSIGYDHVNDLVRIYNTRGISIYHLVFASKNPRGPEFFQKVSKRRFDGQHRMMLDQ